VITETVFALSRGAGNGDVPLLCVCAITLLPARSLPSFLRNLLQPVGGLMIQGVVGSAAAAAGGAFNTFFSLHPHAFQIKHAHCVIYLFA
jgi:hypothetical protein